MSLGTLCVAVSTGSNSRVLAGDNKGYLYLLDWKKGKVRRKFIHTGKKVESVSWHPNGTYLAFVGHDPYIRIYRVEDVLQY